MLDTPSSSSSSSPLQSPSSQPISPTTSSTPPLHTQQPISGSVTVTTIGSTFLIKSPSIPVIAQSPDILTSASAPLGMSLTEGSIITGITKIVSSEKCSSAPAIYREISRSNSNDETNGSTVSPVETQFPFNQNIERKADKKKKRKKNNNVDTTSDFTESEITTPSTELKLIESRLSGVASGCHSTQPIQDFQLFPDDSIPRYSSTSLDHYGYFPAQDREEEDDQINNRIVIEEEARGIRREEGREMDRIHTGYGSMMYTGVHRSVHQIPIYVETFSGTTFEIQILPQETIYCLKMKLQQEEGILVTQQHLIWQGEELKDDFTLEEYGIGFGAILRLVLELRGGPLNNFGHNLPAENYTDDKVEPETNLDQEAQIINETSSNDHSCDQRSDLRQPGFVIFQDGNEIRMYSSSQRTTGTTGTDDRSSIGSADPFGKFNETLFGQGDSTRSGLIDIANMNEQRQRENDVLRFKMREIQSKMKSLALKRSKKLPEPNLTKLPLIMDVKKDSIIDPLSPLRGSSSSSFSNDANRDTKSKLIFPPLVSSSSPSKATLQPIVKINETCETQTERRRNRSKLIEQFNKKYYSHKCKSNSAKIVRRSIHKNNILDSSLDTNYENELSLTGKRNDSKDRPKSTPMTRLVKYCYHNEHNFPSYPYKVNNLKDQVDPSSSQKVTLINLNSPVMSRKDSIKDLGSVKSGVKNDPSKASKDSISLGRSKSKTLPPVKTKSKLSTSKSKNRCFTCNKKLGLATRHDCRCGQMFCTQHRYSETHDCSHDYKSEGRRLIALNNPVVKASKLPKI